MPRYFGVGRAFFRHMQRPRARASHGFVMLVDCNRTGLYILTLLNQWLLDN